MHMLTVSLPLKLRAADGVGLLGPTALLPNVHRPNYKEPATLSSAACLLRLWLAKDVQCDVVQDMGTSGSTSACSTPGGRGRK